MGETRGRRPLFRRSPRTGLLSDILSPGHIRQQRQDAAWEAVCAEKCWRMDILRFLWLSVADAAAWPRSEIFGSLLPCTSFCQGSWSKIPKKRAGFSWIRGVFSQGTRAARAGARQDACTGTGRPWRPARGRDEARAGWAGEGYMAAAAAAAFSPAMMPLATTSLFLVLIEPQVEPEA